MYDSPKIKILRLRLFILHEHREQISIESEYTIKSKSKGLENIMIVTDGFMPNLKVKDNDGHVLSVMTREDTQRLIRQYIKKSHGERRTKYEDLLSKISSGQLHVVWIKLPKSRAMIKNEIRTFVLAYSPYETESNSLLTIQVKERTYTLYYTLFAPDEFDFKNTRYRLNKDNAIKPSAEKPDNVQTFKTYNSTIFRITSKFKDNFEILYSFKPASASSMPTKIGLWTLAGFAAAILALKHVVFWGEPPDIAVFSRQIEIGLFTIGGSLLLPQLASNRFVRSRYTKWYWIPVALGALLLV